MDLSIVEKIKFNDLGLVPAIAQQHDSGEVLMLAWMNIGTSDLLSQIPLYFHFSEKIFVIWQKNINFVRN